MIGSRSASYSAPDMRHLQSAAAISASLLLWQWPGSQGKKGGIIGIILIIVVLLKVSVVVLDNNTSNKCYYGCKSPNRKNQRNSRHSQVNNANCRNNNRNISSTSQTSCKTRIKAISVILRRLIIAVILVVIAITIKCFRHEPQHRHRVIVILAFVITCLIAV